MNSETFERICHLINGGSYDPYSHKGFLDLLNILEFESDKFRPTTAQKTAIIDAFQKRLHVVRGNHLAQIGET